MNTNGYLYFSRKLFEKEYTRQSVRLYLNISIGSNVFIELDPRLGKTITYALKAFKSALRAY